MVWRASDILGLWADSGGEGAKFSMAVLTELRNRGVKDCFLVVWDGLKGLPEVIGNLWPLATVQTGIVHLIRPLPPGRQAGVHFPTEQAAYLVARSVDQTGRGRARWAMRWKPALNAFAITFAETH